MPRHEFFARGSDAAIREEIKIVSSPMAATLRDKIICFFGDIKSQNTLSISQKINASAVPKTRGPMRNIQIHAASDLKVNLGLNKFTGLIASHFFCLRIDSKR
jgi:hypothetical protein